MKRKSVCYLSVTLIFAMLLSVRVYAMTLSRVTILPGGANFRTAPSLKSRVMELLPKGLSFQPEQDIDGVWYRVNHNGRSGYLHGSRLRFDAASASSKRHDRSIVTARQEAVVAFAGNRWSEVISSLHPFVDSDQAEFNDLFMLGFAFQQIRQYDQALAKFELAVSKHVGAIDTGFIEAHRHLGNLYVRSRQFDRAVRAYDRLLARSPVLVWAILGKGDALLASGNSRQAIAEYTRAVSCEPENPEPFVKLGKAFLHISSADKALRCYQAALQLRPQHQEALVGCAEAHIALGDLAQARSILEKDVNQPEFAAVRKKLNELTMTETVYHEINQAQLELENLVEKQRLSGMLELDVTLVTRVQRSVYEVRLPSGKHAFLRLNNAKPESAAGAFKVIASRLADARVRPRVSQNETELNSIPYFKQVSEKERLAYENISFKIEEIERQIAQKMDTLHKRF